MFSKPNKLIEKLYCSDPAQRRNIISDEISETGYNPSFQEINYQNSNGCNISVDLKGISTSTVIISAHYDGHGAYDNISGVYMLLSLIDKFRNTTPFYSLRFVFFDKEEEGQIGSKLFVRHYDNLFGIGSKNHIIQHIAIDGCGIGEKLVYIYNIDEITFFNSKKEFTIPLLADFRSFQKHDIPSIHTFSLPEEEAVELIFDRKFPSTWFILHSEDDNLKKINMKCLNVFESNIMKALNMINKSKSYIFQTGVSTIEHFGDSCGY